MWSDDPDSVQFNSITSTLTCGHEGVYLRSDLLFVDADFGQP